MRVLVASLNQAVAVCAYIGIDRVGPSFLLLNLHAPCVGVVKTFSGFALQAFGVYFGLLSIRLGTDSVGFLLFRLESGVSCVPSDVGSVATFGVCAPPPPKKQHDDDDNDDNDDDNDRDDEPDDLLGGHDEPFHLARDWCE